MNVLLLIRKDIQLINIHLIIVKKLMINIKKFFLQPIKSIFNKMKIKKKIKKKDLEQID